MTSEEVSALKGSTIWLAQDYQAHKRGEPFELSGVKPVGDTLYITGKPGLFVPLAYVMFNDPLAPPKQKKKEPIVDNPEDNFCIPGYESDAALMGLFRGFAPNIEEARALYVLYQSEIGEHDTDILVALMEKIGLPLGDMWTKAQIQQMYIHLTASLTAADLGGVPEMETAVETFLAREKEVEIPWEDPQAQEDSAAEAQETRMEQQLEVPIGSIPIGSIPIGYTKKGGRPKGSKNKPKDQEQEQSIIPPMTWPTLEQLDTASNDSSYNDSSLKEWAVYRMADMLPDFIRLLLDHPEQFDAVVDGAKEMARKACR